MNSNLSEEMAMLNDNVIDLSKTFKNIDKFKQLMCWYGCAIREVRTKLEVLNDDFQYSHSRNPIDNIKSRIKSEESMKEKLKRKGLEVN